MVPKGWKKRDLHKLITIKHGFAFKSEYFSNDGQYVLLTPGSFNESGGFRNQGPKTKFYSGPIPNGYLLSKGDLLLAMTEQAEGLLGSPLFVPEDNKYLHNQRLGLVEINCPDKICSDFLYLLFNHADSRKQITEQSTGTKVKHTSPDRLCSVIGLIPPLLEQKKIAQILSIWDKAISVTEKLLANSQQQKKALMQQLLTGKKRLLDENGVRFSGEWKITKLIQMGKVVSGGTPDTNMAMYWEGDILWLTPTDVTALTGRFVSNTSRKITPAGLLNSSAVLLPKGSLMVCTRATIGALAISTSEICTNQGFKNIIPNEGFNIEFIYYLLQMNTNEMIKKSSGSTFLELSKKDFETLSFSCPFIKEQQKIAAVLSAADTEISTLEKKLACLKDEKKALMQQLLTGKRRVKVDEAVAV